MHHLGNRKRVDTPGTSSTASPALVGYVPLPCSRESSDATVTAPYMNHLPCGRYTHAPAAAAEARPVHQGRRAARGNRIRVRHGNSNISSAWPPEDPDDPESSVAHLRGVDRDWIMQDLYTCRYTHTLHMLHTMRTYCNRPTPTDIHRLCSPQQGGAAYRAYLGTLQGVRDQLTIPSRIGRHMREKGAVVGPDTFLAQTLISAVRLSGTTDGWEGAKRRVGCRRYMSEVPCGACSSGTCSWYIPAFWREGPGVCAYVCMSGLHQSGILLCSPHSTAALHPHKAYSGQPAHAH